MEIKKSKLWSSWISCWNLNLFFAVKMEEINKIIKEMWQATYRGTDIDTLEIRCDSETSTAKSRSFNYRQSFLLVFIIYSYLLFIDYLRFILLFIIYFTIYYHLIFINFWLFIESFAIDTVPKDNYFTIQVENMQNLICFICLFIIVTHSFIIYIIAIEIIY